jgi:hypothetical protein
MNSGLQTDVCMQYFSKAFDYFSHNKRLLNKIKGYGITGKVNNCIEDFVGDRSQAVAVDGSISSSIPVA